MLVAFGALSVSGASAQLVTVQGTAGPWSTSVNPTYNYSDDSAQTASTDVAVTPGLIYSIAYVAGHTTTDGIETAQADANGYCCQLGPGFNSPGQYTAAVANLMELVGTFAGPTGAIVGTPFVIGNGPTAALAPVGASQLQLGINDNLYHDNTDSLLISVSTVPEPETYAMTLAGLLFLALAARRSRTPL